MASLPPGSRVGIYCRISRDPAHDELGVRRQERECRELAARNGWDVVEVYVDDDRSAYSGRPRPAYERLLQDLREGRLQGVVCWHPDRLTRHPRELEGLIDTLEAAGAAVATVVGGDYDLSTASGRMVARVVGATARHESERKSERLRSKMAELVRAGKLTGGGKRPYGYEADRLTVRPSEAVIVREMVGRVLAGESVLSVVKDLNERGVPAASGGPWTLASASRLLRSPRIAGLRDWHGQLLAAPWPAIVSPRDHATLRALLAQHAPSGARRARTYLLTGFVVCGACGAQMFGRVLRGHPSYGCFRVPAHGRPAGCNRVFARSEPVDQLVTAALFDLVDGPGFAGVFDTLTRPSEPDHLIEAIETQRDRLREIEAAYGGGAFDLAEYRRLRDAARARLRELEAQIQPRRPSALEPWRDRSLEAAWPTLPLGQRRAILSALGLRVTIEPRGRASGPRFDPSRVRVSWAALGESPR